MRRLWGVLVLVLLATEARAQSISPVIVEYQEKARGRFQITNQTLYPLSVVVEPLSFSVDGNGEPRYRPLDPEIRVRLSRASFRVSPRQSYTVFYEATAQRLPAWFTIYATLTGATTKTGLQIGYKLPHTVYLLTKQPLARESVFFLRAQAAGGRAKIDAEVENRGQEFSRVQEVEVASADGKKQTYPGFPFFPGQRRKLKLDWGQPREPQRIVLKFTKFHVEHPVQAVAGPP